MANLVEFGLSNVHVGTVSLSDGAYTFGTPAKYPGAVNLKMNSNFESTKVSADNIAYYIANSNLGYSNELEMVKEDVDFMKKYVGLQASEDGAIVESSNQRTQEFYIMFQIEGDESPTKYILYRNSLTDKPSYEHKTLEEGKIEVETVTYKFDTLPLADGTGVIKAAYPKGVAGYETLFTKAPTVPKISNVPA